jgi:hypothetical protein
MPRDVIKILIDPDRPEYAPAQYLAIIAYPRKDEIDRRSLFMMTLRRHYFDMLARDEAQKNKPRMIEPFLFAISEKMMKDGLSRGMDRLQDQRLIAAEMAFKIIRTRNDGDKISLNAVAEMVSLHFSNLSETGKGPTPPNLEHRQWGTSKPVMHLALTLRNELFRVSPDKSEKDTAITDLLDRPEWLMRAIADAEVFRNYICNSPDFRIYDADTIKVEA